uniref:Uncharacterized protein n=1 Tax=Zea mays TaxID=4577 RepID=B6UDT5_MAIZE|nr:hypothetical protein [Zea mays]
MGWSCRVDVDVDLEDGMLGLLEKLVAEDPGVQRIEVAEQELIEGEEHVVQEEPHNEEFDLI